MPHDSERFVFSEEDAWKVWDDSHCGFRAVRVNGKWYKLMGGPTLTQWPDKLEIEMQEVLPHIWDQ